MPEPQNIAVNWPEEFGASVTVIDCDFTIVYMNEAAITTFAKRGGRTLIGTDVRLCHQERSVHIIEHILSTGEPHTYIIEKHGQKRLIHQAPWHERGEIAGVVEISFEIPTDMAHYTRE